MQILTASDEANRRNAYDRANSDREAADLVGTSVGTFAAWRRSRGLKPITRIDFDEVLRQELWNYGWNDHQIADVVGLTPVAIQKWRVRQNLPPNVDPPVPVDNQRYMNAVLETRDDREAATILGIGRSTVAAWRKKHGIPATVKRAAINRASRSETNRQKWDAYCLNINARSAAAMIGIPESAFTRWIRSQGLPSYCKYRQVRKAIMAEVAKGDRIALRAARMHGWTGER